MSALHPDPAIRPFSKSGYEIFDDGFDRGEVMIWSVAPTQPQSGDLLLIERGGRPYDLTIAEVRAVEGGWVAACRVAPAITSRVKPDRPPRLTPAPRGKG